MIKQQMQIVNSRETKNGEHIIRFVIRLMQRTDTYEFLESLICTDLLLKSQQLNELDEVLFISFSVLLMGRKRHATCTVSLSVLVSGVVLEVKFI